MPPNPPRTSTAYHGTLALTLTQTLTLTLTCHGMTWVLPWPCHAKFKYIVLSVVEPCLAVVVETVARWRHGPTGVLYLALTGLTLPIHPTWSCSTAVLLYIVPRCVVAGRHSKLSVGVLRSTTDIPGIHYQVCTTRRDCLSNHSYTSITIVVHTWSRYLFRASWLFHTNTSTHTSAAASSARRKKIQ